MQVLVTGFQRSGTTLLRRLLQLHPEIKKVFHEQVLLKREPRMLKVYLRSKKVHVKRDNWGEKVPYYNKIKTEPVERYLRDWMTRFSIRGKIIHIVRHPYDTANSVV